MKYPSRLIILAVFLASGCGHSQSNSINGAHDVSADALKAAARDPGVRQFYAAEGWHAVWSKKAEKALGEALAKRADNGLDRVVFLTTAVDASPEAREANLTRAALAYASALAKGVVDPKTLHKIYTVPRPDPDLAAGLLGALQNGKVGQWLSGLAPDDAEYHALSQVYQQMRQVSHDSSSAAIPDAGPAIRPGQNDPRIPRVATVLHTLGYLGQPGDSHAKRYTPALVGAVRKFQKDSGDKVSGLIDKGTIDELNTAPADRAGATAVALERRRWLGRKPPATRIEVNIATAMLVYVRDGRSVDQRRVIVGQPDWETPQLQASLFQLVANPTWTVPKTIEEKEMSNVSADYLARHNMVRRDNFIVQLSGPSNALGLVKFDLDDKFAIYLHDTPEKSWFATNTRHRSHGCVRVDGALAFADMIAGEERISGKWQQARATGSESFVKLPRPITVRLLYHPTWVDAANRVHFDPDIYAWNEPIAQQLGFGTGRARRMAPTVSDVGP